MIIFLYLFIFFLQNRLCTLNSRKNVKKKEVTLLNNEKDVK